MGKDGQGMHGPRGSCLVGLWTCFCTRRVVHGRGQVLSSPFGATCAKRLAESPDLRRKLVLHRGFARWHPEDTTRPVQNTRQAFLDAASLGVAYAECDVWATSDGRIVLSHDQDFRKYSFSCEDELATKPIGETQWSSLQHLKLHDGSNPVLLDTVLSDLTKTKCTNLVVELKNAKPAMPLGCFMQSAGSLVDAVGWVMSFSFEALETFKEAAGKGCRTRILWLLDNYDYAPGTKNDGETTFRYESETFSQFLARTDMRERFESLGCGLYLQYMPSLTPARLAGLREELVAEIPGNHFIGLWTDAGLDEGFDRAANIREWIRVADAVNTDMRENFWDI